MNEIDACGHEPYCCAFSTWMFPCYRDFNLQDMNWHKIVVTSPTDIPFTVANRYQVTSYPISDAHKFSHILYTSIPFPPKTGIHIFLCFRFLVISAALSSCAWINSSFTLAFTYLCNIPYIRRNIVKGNKSYVRICRNLEVGSNLKHTYLAFPHIYPLYRDISLHYFQYNFQKQ